jgi:two-component system, LytTR family, response regulator
MTIRAMIVDDEPLARRRIRSLLDEAEDVEVLAECANGREAIRAIGESPPDLLFLDIQMPELDGFDVLQSIGVGRVPVVIFVTAYDQFALRAFEAHALDYLLKPFDDERFEAALQRARERIHQQQGGDLDRRLRALLERMRGEHQEHGDRQHGDRQESGDRQERLDRPEWGDRHDSGNGPERGDRPERGYLQRLVVPTGQRSVFVRTEEIDWIEAERNYIRLHVSGRSYLLRENLTRIESALDPTTFCRIHRSTIVNIDRIQAVESLFRGEYRVLLHDGTKLTSGRSYRGKLHQLMGKDS